MRFIAVRITTENFWKWLENLSWNNISKKTSVFSKLEKV